MGFRYSVKQIAKGFNVPAERVIIMLRDQKGEADIAIKVARLRGSDEPLGTWPMARKPATLSSLSATPTIAPSSAPASHPVAGLRRHSH